MRPEVRAGLWTLFALIVLAGGWLFLRACGTWPMFGWERNYCPAPVDRHAYAREIEIGAGLQRQVHAAEMALAEKPPCPAPATPTPDPTRQPATPSAPPPPLTPQQRVESRDLDKEVEKRHGKRGKLQFTLSWNTLDDLDINVDCPGGRISSAPGHFGPGICGDGVKDIDANRNLTENVRTDPIENVSWSTDVPSGPYKIEVINYRPKYKTGAIVPFKLRMRWNDQERTCQNVVTTVPDAEMKTVDGKMESGTARAITWQSGGDLPTCDFEVLKTFRGNASK